MIVIRLRLICKRMKNIKWFKETAMVYIRTKNNFKWQSTICQVSSETQLLERVSFIQETVKMQSVACSMFALSIQFATPFLYAFEGGYLHNLAYRNNFIWGWKTEGWIQGVPYGKWKAFLFIYWHGFNPDYSNWLFTSFHYIH